jgi:hypothetical protein
MASQRLSKLPAIAITRFPDAPRRETKIRHLIGRMSLANPALGAPRIHGDRLKLDVEFSQTTVGRHLHRGPKAPSPIWQSLLRNRDDLFALRTLARSGYAAPYRYDEADGPSLRVTHGTGRLRSNLL